MMVAMEAIAPDAVAGYAAIGELALDGSIRTVPGALPAAIGANAMGKGLICPAACGPEAAWAGEDVDILAAPHLRSLVNHFKGLQTLSRPKPNAERDTARRQGPGASCKRGPRCAAEYQARISGPLLDRIDLQIEVPALSAADLVLRLRPKAARKCARG